jgi:hypothetical protein
MDKILKEERKKIEEICRENEELKSNLEKKKENVISLEKERKDEKVNLSHLEIELARTKRAKNDVNLELTAC